LSSKLWVFKSQNKKFNFLLNENHKNQRMFKIFQVLHLSRKWSKIFQLNCRFILYKCCFNNKLIFLIFELLNYFKTNIMFLLKTNDSLHHENKSLWTVIGSYGKLLERNCFSKCSIKCIFFLHDHIFFNVRDECTWWNITNESA